MSSKLAYATKLVENIEACLEYFDQACTNVERMFRKPGRQQNVLLLQKYFESGKGDIAGIVAAHPEITAHDVSHLFKGLLRSVKETCGQPIVNYVCYAPLLQVGKAKLSPKETTNKMANILRVMMIPAHRSLLKRLSLYFYGFAKHAVTTKMDIRSLATCIAASVFMRPTGKRPEGVTPAQFDQQCLMAEMNDMKHICKTFALMITYSHQIFGQIDDKPYSPTFMPQRKRRSITADFRSAPHMLSKTDRGKGSFGKNLFLSSF